MYKNCTGKPDKIQAKAGNDLSANLRGYNQISEDIVPEGYWRRLAEEPVLVRELFRDAFVF